MQKEFIEYQHNGVVMQGCFFSHDKTPRPTVLIIPTVLGRTEQSLSFAERIYHMGYNAFTADMYGKDMLNAKPEQCFEYMDFLRADRQLLHDRVNIILETVKNLAEVDEYKVAAIGYCFGGLSVLDLARSGADLKGVISVHGILGKDTHINNVKQIIPKVLVLHGSDDPLAPLSDLLTFREEMNAANANWETHIYGQVAHAFTNPNANTPERGIAYDAQADERSWLAAEIFLSDLFKPL